MPKRKKEEADVSSGTKKAKKVEDSCAKFLSLAATDDSLLAGLTYFLTRVQGDGDTTLLTDYLGRHPDCSHVLAPLAWDRERRSLDVLLLCFRCLEQILLYTAPTTISPPIEHSVPNSISSASTSFSKLSHSVGSKLVQTIVQSHMRPIYSSLMSTVPTKLMGSCLSLLAAMVTQGPRSAREVQLIFNFGYKALGVLPSRTNRILGMSDSVRLYFIKFALSFLVVGDSEVIKAVLETRGFLSSVFKLLPKDSPATVHLFLATLLEKVVLNTGISKKTKSGFFNQYALKQISQLLFGKDSHQKPAVAPGSPELGELRGFVFEFLMTLCTDFQHGVCYRSKNMPLGLDRTNNPVILQLLLSLSGSVTNPLMQELTTRAVSACPDLLLSYLRSLSFSLEPRANSRWMTNTEFLIKLFSSLPAVPQLWGLKEGEEPPHTHVPISVKFSVPMLTSRSMLTQGILNSTPLVKHETLRLMDLILMRAAATVDCLNELRKAGADSFLVLYCDSVLKQLPDIKTVVTVRQQLLSGGTSLVPRSEEGGLSPQERLKNAELVEDNSLLALVLTVMRGYQKLSPTIFAQVDFNVAKLLPSLPPPPAIGPQGNNMSCDSHIMLPTLLLLLNAPPDSLKWQQQSKATLSILLWLFLGGDGDVSSLARQVLLKLLLGCYALKRYQLDLEVTLAAMRSNYRCGSHPSPEYYRLLIATVAEVMVSVVREPYVCLEEVKSIILRRGGEGLDDMISKADHCSLQEILGSPLEMPVQDTGEATHARRGLRVVNWSLGTTVCPLIPCLLSKLVQVETGPLLPFISGLLLQLHLVQESYEAFASVVLYYFGLETVQESLLSGLQPWRHLSKSLLQFFCCWLREPPSEVVAVLEDSTFCTEGLSPRKALKKLAKMPTSDKILSVLSSLAGSDIIKCLPEIAEIKPLSETVLHYASVRPMHLLENNDEPSVSEMVKSLPFTALLLQSIPSSITRPTISHSPAVSALIVSLSQTNVQALLRSSVELSKSDSLELTCAARSILMLLQNIFSDCKLSGLQDDELSAVEFCFELLSRIISVTIARTETESETTYSPLELLSSIFNSQLTKQAFLEGIFQPNAEIDDKPKSKRKRGSSCKADVVFSEKIGDLLDDTLVHYPEFKATAGFDYCFKKLLNCLGSWRSDSSQCDVLLRLFKKLVPYVELKQLLGFCESFISSSLLSCSSQEVDILASVLYTVFLSSSSSEQLYSLESDDIVMSGDSGGVALSDTAVKRLIDHALKSNSEKLDCVLFAILSQKTFQNLPILALREAASSTCSEADSLVSSIKSLARDLILSSAEELCGVDKAYETHALQLESSSFLKEKLPPELDALLSGLQSKTREKGFLDLTYDEMLFVNKSDKAKLLSLLSEDYVVRVLDHCLIASTPICTKLACLLVENVDVALEYFTASPMLLKLCETAASKTDQTKLHMSLYLLEKYLCTLAKKQTAEQGELLCSGWTEAVKVIRKKLWNKCSFLVVDGDSSPELKAISSQVLQSLCSLSSKAKKHLRKLAREWNDIPKWNRYQLTLAVEASCSDGDSYCSAIVLGRVLHQLVEVLAEREGPQFKEREENREEYLMKLAGRLLKARITLSLSSELDAELWKRFVHTALRKRFTQPSTLWLLTALLRAVYSVFPGDLLPGKFMSLETLYQMVWSHSEFLHVMCSSHDQAVATQLADTKEKLTELLVTVVDLQPSVGQSTHVAVLLSAYSATRSKTDQGLLYLLYQYEKNGASVGEYRPFLWGPAALEQYKIRREVGWLLWKQPDTQEVVEQLDRELLLHSSENFPLYVQLEPANPFTKGSSEADTELAEAIYDPCFLLPLFSHLLDSSCLVDCHQFVESGCLGYLISSLSSMCEGVRVAGCHTLSRFCTHLEGSRSREKLQIALLLEVLRNSLKKSCIRVPSFFTAFATRAAQLFLHPESKFYPVLAHYLVYKPALDLQEIPLFYMLLHSSSPQHNQERSWLLELLINGLRCEEDYFLYRKRKVLSQAMALHDSPFVNHKCQALILQLIHKACSIPVVATDLVWNQGLLAWLHHVIRGTREKKSLLQILVALWHTVENANKRADTSSYSTIKVPPLFEEELAFTFGSTLC